MPNLKKIFLDEDTSLMLKAAKGNGRAYEKLYKKYFSAVVSFLTSLNYQLRSAEDLAQEVFVRIWENKARYQPNATFKTYVFGYAKNVMQEYKNAFYKENFSIEQNLKSFPVDFQNNTANENDYNIVLLKKLIAELPDKQRQCLELVYLCDFTPAEAAEILKCSLDAVYTSLYRARTRLRQSISPVQIR